MKFGSHLIGLALCMAMTASAVAHDAGSAAPAAIGGADQGNGGGKSGMDVDTLFGPKGKDAKGTGASSKLQPVVKLQTLAQAGQKPSIAGTAKIGTLSNKASAGSGSPVGVAPPSHTPTSAGAAAATTNGPSINGTAMVRPAARTATVGGSAKVTPGVLSGSSITPKHP